MNNTDNYVFWGLVILALLIGYSIRFFYERGFNKAQNDAEATGIFLSKDDLRNIYWLATNGFKRLIIFGQKSNYGGLRDLKRAEEMHHSLERLETFIDLADKLDEAESRMFKLMIFWNDKPLSPPHELLKKQWLEES